MQKEEKSANSTKNELEARSEVVVGREDEVVAENPAAALTHEVTIRAPPDHFDHREPLAVADRPNSVPFASTTRVATTVPNLGSPSFGAAAPSRR